MEETIFSSSPFELRCHVILLTSHTESRTILTFVLSSPLPTVPPLLLTFHNQQHVDRPQQRPPPPHLRTMLKPPPAVHPPMVNDLFGEWRLLIFVSKMYPRHVAFVETHWMPCPTSSSHCRLTDMHGHVTEQNLTSSNIYRRKHARRLTKLECR